MTSTKVVQPSKCLCTTFCEAKDCVIALNGDDEKATKKCNKIRENFVKLTGETMLPCEDHCPCWDLDYLALQEGETITAVSYAYDAFGGF